MMMEEDHHEAAYAYVEEEGDYGGPPQGVNLHILMGGEHEGHGHDDGATVTVAKMLMTRTKKVTMTRTGMTSTATMPWITIRTAG